MSPAVTGLLPNREGDLVLHFIRRCNSRLFTELGADPEFAKLKTTQKIRAAVKRRLEMLAPHIDTWPQAVAILAKPQNVPDAVETLGHFISDVWYAAGDRSTDSNWYTKRALLTAVYTSTELYMLTDYSPHFEETWAHLDRRLDDVALVGKLARGASSSVRGALDRLMQAAAAAMQPGAAAGGGPGTGAAAAGAPYV